MESQECTHAHACRRAQARPGATAVPKDVLDLRAAGWVNRKPKKIEGPTTLGQQAKMADASEKGCTAQVMPITLAERRAAVVLKPKAAQPVVEKKAPVAYDEEAFRGEMAVGGPQKTRLQRSPGRERCSPAEEAHLGGAPPGTREG